MYLPVRSAQPAIGFEPFCGSSSSRNSAIVDDKKDVNSTKTSRDMIQFNLFVVHPPRESDDVFNFYSKHHIVYLISI